ncbi:hypothetical protein PZ897_02180 [Hoeflea sp. YIM 152468]|uniref:hypothetical protein n=1 Tax=Hoeflea sp. YIM 152468 TaxID=3031759 RepID=UPI0023DCDA2F|nr:hypothetical protein [Hoeflea sp. YIM 152468]MDF1606979.1 hypothetical protein [Hoeflea sp. YIM 152468]
MFEIFRFAADLWLIAGMLVVIWFLGREFDFRQSGDWAGLAVSAPVIIWSIWLAAQDVAAAFGQLAWPGAAWLRLAGVGG